jgi:hypothetical protein
MFNINKAQFSNVTGNVTFVNNELSPTLLINNPIRTTNSSGVVTVYHRDHGMYSTNDYVTISGIPAGTYNGIASTALNGTFTNLLNITLDSYQITTTGTATASGDVGGNTVYASQNYIMDTANLAIQNLTVPGTGIIYGLKTTTGKSVNGSESEFILSSTASNIAPGNNIYFNNPQMIASTINETNKMNNSKSLFLTCNLTTTNVNVSPVIDTTRTSIVAVQNRLNNPTSGNTINFVDDTTATGTSTAGVYVTRPITLTNTSTALQVTLTSNVRSSASVRVYYRVTDSTQVKNINTLSWTPFNVAGEEDMTVTPASNSVTFQDYVYSDKGITGFTAFQIKVVLKGTNSSQPPVVSALRGIALAL